MSFFLHKNDGFGFDSRIFRQTLNVSSDSMLSRLNAGTRPFIQTFPLIRAEVHDTFGLWSADIKVSPFRQQSTLDIFILACGCGPYQVHRGEATALRAGKKKIFHERLGADQARKLTPDKAVSALRAQVFGRCQILKRNLVHDETSYLKAASHGWKFSSATLSDASSVRRRLLPPRCQGTSFDHICNMIRSTYRIPLSFCSESLTAKLKCDRRKR